MNVGEGVHDTARKRRADDERNRLSREKEGQGLALPVRWIPIIEVEDNTWEETCFGNPQEKPQDIKHRLSSTLANLAGAPGKALACDETGPAEFYYVPAAPGHAEMSGNARVGPSARASMAA